MNLSGLSHRLAHVIRPTGWQAFVSLVVAAFALTVGNQADVLHRLGIGSQAIHTFQSDVTARLERFLNLPVLSNLTMVTFWAGVGLLAYLACWALYNTFVAAENEVTIKTSYTNQRGGTGVAAVLGLKMVAAVVLVIYLVGFDGDLKLWHALSNPILHSFSAANAGLFAAGWAGQALQLYGLFVLLQLLLTRWYLPDPFTNGEK